MAVQSFFGFRAQGLIRVQGLRVKKVFFQHTWDSVVVWGLEKRYMGSVLQRVSFTKKSLQPYAIPTRDHYPAPTIPIKCEGPPILRNTAVFVFLFFRYLFSALPHTNAAP